MAAAVLLAVAVVALIFVSESSPAVVASVALWGLAYGALPLAIQIWTMRAVPDAPEAGLALLVSANQTSTAIGSFIGGLVVDHLGISVGFALTAGLALIGALSRTATPNSPSAREENHALRQPPSGTPTWPWSSRRHTSNVPRRP